MAAEVAGTRTQRGDRALRERRLGLQTALLLSLLVALMRWIHPEWRPFRLIEDSAYDLMFDLAPPHVPGDVVIVAIDDESVSPKRLGRFPWSRRAYARLLDALADARVVGIDVLLAEPDAVDSGGDRALARAIARHGRVVLAAHAGDRTMGSDDLSAAARLSARGYPPPQALALAPDYVPHVPPTSELLDVAAGVGYVDLWPDGDGVFRRARVVQLKGDGQVHPHFSLETARVAEGLAPSEIRLGPAGLTLGRRTLPLAPDGSMLIRYAGPAGTIVRCSFADVVDGRLPGRMFAGKIVVVGATAPGLHDVRPAPFHHDASGVGTRVFMGAETNANVVYSLLAALPLRDGTVMSWAWAGLSALLGALLAAIAWSGVGSASASGGHFEVLGPVSAAAAFVAISALLFGGAFHWAGVVTPAGAYVPAMGASLAFSVADRLWSEARQRRRIWTQFQRYASDELVRAVAKDPALVSPGRREITVLFADIRGFTSLAESTSPERLIPQLRQYLTEMNECVFAHDGWLDKFMGDGIMALYGALGPREGHARRAVGTALAMLDRLDELNASWRERGLPELHIGIGCHTGTAVVGNLGSRRRAQYTAVGDCVNVAARVEPETKPLGVPFLFTQETAVQLGPEIPTVRVGQSHVRGRAQPVTLYTVAALGPPEGGDGDAATPASAG